MAPPSKKRKVAEEAAEPSKDVEMADAAKDAQLDDSSFDALDKMVDRFVHNLEDMREAQGCLLDIKSFQRTVLRGLQASEKRLEERHVAVEKHRTTLANLSYEQGHWESKIQFLQNSSKTPALESLCRDELNDTESETLAVIQQYLPRDIAASDHDSQAVVEFLQNELKERQNLEVQLQQTQREYANVTAITKKRTQFLHQLPDKLKDMEKASLPLQRFFAATAGSSGAASSQESKNATSSERETRLQMARSLPGPLYTLLVQLQSYVDDYPNKQMNLDTSKVTTAVYKEKEDTHVAVWKDPHEKVVLLQIPIPVITSVPSMTGGASSSNNITSKNKVITIAFTYFESLGVVTAKVTSGDEKLDAATLLRLNPHDTGSYQVSDDSEDSKPSNEDNGTTVDSISDPYGKPYLWCNYIAGLQLLQGQHPHEQLKASTRVIMATLARQLRSQATLYYILNRLLPSNPRASALGVPASTSCLAKVSSFQLASNKEDDGNSDSDTKTYKIQLKRGNNSVSISFRLNPSQYPVTQPPQWSLTGNTLQWGQKHGSRASLEGDGDPPPLHNARLAAIEAKVNDIDGLLLSLREKNNSDGEDDKGKDGEENKDDPEVEDQDQEYEWILTHQLRTILLEWDDYVTDESGTASNANAAVRSVRGRDRAKVE